MKRVRVALGRTISLKQYESLRVDVAIENESGDPHIYENLFDRTLHEAKLRLAETIEEAKRDLT